MFLKMNKVEWGRLLWHMPHGILAAVLFFAPIIIMCITSLPVSTLIIIGFAGAMAGLAWMALIICYQFIEDWRIGDRSYHDFRGYMTGFAAAVILLVLYLVIKAIVA
jgi:hypothetical protein